MFETEAAVEILTELQDIQAHLNESVVLQCTLSKEGKTVTWYKNGVKICSDDDQYTISSEAFDYKLQIPKCTLADAGCFTLRYRDIETSCQVTVLGRCRYFTHDSKCEENFAFPLMIDW